MFNEYWFWADRYGWPPSVVDEQPIVTLDRLLEVQLTVEAHRREVAEADG